jgi:hypothetical protein
MPHSRKPVGIRLLNESTDMPTDPPGDLGFFAEPAPSWDEVGLVRLPPKRRGRKASLLSQVKQFQKAGLPVRAAESYVDGSSRFEFAEPEAQGVPIDTPDQPRRLI